MKRGAIKRTSSFLAALVLVFSLATLVRVALPAAQAAPSPAINEDAIVFSTASGAPQVSVPGLHPLPGMQIKDEHYYPNTPLGGTSTQQVPWACYHGWGWLTCDPASARDRVRDNSEGGGLFYPLEVYSELTDGGKSIQWTIDVNRHRFNQLGNNYRVAFGIPTAVEMPTSFQVWRYNVDNQATPQTVTSENWANAMRNGAIMAPNGGFISNFFNDYSGNIGYNSGKYGNILDNVTKIFTFTVDTPYQPLRIRFTTPIADFHPDAARMPVGLSDGGYFFRQLMFQKITAMPISFADEWVGGPLTVQGLAPYFSYQGRAHQLLPVAPRLLQPSQIGINAAPSGSLCADNYSPNPNANPDSQPCAPQPPKALLAYSYLMPKDSRLVNQGAANPAELNVDTPNYTTQNTAYLSAANYRGQGYPLIVSRHTYSPLTPDAASAQKYNSGPFYGVTSVETDTQLTPMSFPHTDVPYNVGLGGIKLHVKLPVSTRQGDMFYLTVPRDFYWQNDGPAQLLAPNGEVVANVYSNLEDSYLTFVATDYITRHPATYEGYLDLPQLQIYKQQFPDSRTQLPTQWVAYSRWGTRNVSKNEAVATPLTDPGFNLLSFAETGVPADSIPGQQLLKTEGLINRYTKTVTYRVLYNPARLNVTGAYFVDSLFPLANYTGPQNTAVSPEWFLQLSPSIAPSSLAITYMKDAAASGIRLYKIKKDAKLPATGFAFAATDLELVNAKPVMMGGQGSVEHPGGNVGFYYQMGDISDAYLVEYTAFVSDIDWAMNPQKSVYNNARFVYEQNGQQNIGNTYIGLNIFKSKGEVSATNNSSLVIHKVDQNGLPVDGAQFTAQGPTTYLNGKAQPGKIYYSQPTGTPGEYAFTYLPPLNVVSVDQVQNPQTGGWQPVTQGQNGVVITTPVGSSPGPNGAFYNTTLPYYTITESGVPAGYMNHEAGAHPVSMRYAQVNQWNNYWCSSYEWGAPPFAPPPNTSEAYYNCQAPTIADSKQVLLTCRGDNCAPTSANPSGQYAYVRSIAPGEVSWVNLREYTFALSKQTRTGHTLSGIEFTLTGTGANSRYRQQATTDSTGLAIWTGLKVGNYVLTETNLGPHEGLYKPLEPLTLTVQSDGQISINGSEYYTSNSTPYVVVNLPAAPAELGFWAWQVNQNQVQLTPEKNLAASGGNATGAEKIAHVRDQTAPRAGLNGVQVTLETLNPRYGRAGIQGEPEWIPATSDSLFNPQLTLTGQPVTSNYRFTPTVQTAERANCAATPFPPGPRSTDCAGYYQFSNLIPGYYRVKFSLPQGMSDDGWRFVAPFQTAGKALNSNNYPAQPGEPFTVGYSEPIFLAPKQTNYQVDVGAYQKVSTQQIGVLKLGQLTPDSLAPLKGAQFAVRDVSQAVCGLDRVTPDDLDKCVNFAAASGEDDESAADETDYAELYPWLCGTKEAAAGTNASTGANSTLEAPISPNGNASANPASADSETDGEPQPAANGEAPLPEMIPQLPGQTCTSTAPGEKPAAQFFSAPLKLSAVYELVETAAPDLHQLLAEPVYFYLGDDGITLLHGQSSLITTPQPLPLADSDPSEPAPASVAPASGPSTSGASAPLTARPAGAPFAGPTLPVIQIVDVEIGHLPATGGPGHLATLGGGGILLIIGALALRRRRAPSRA